MTEDARLAFLRELERADEAVAATLAELDELAAEVEAIRNRAVEVERFQILVPAERARRRDAVSQAEEAAAAARETRAQAEDELAHAETGDEGRTAAARRFEVRARDAYAIAEHRLQEARSELDRLEEEARAAASESERLERRATELADSLRERERLATEAGAPPAAGLAGVAEWASRARAALFVARGALAAERDALVRQANELGSLVLGEPLSGSAATAARRVARSLEGE